MNEYYGSYANYKMPDFSKVQYDSLTADAIGELRLMHEIQTKYDYNYTSVSVNTEINEVERTSRGYYALVSASVTTTESGHISTTVIRWGISL